MRSTPEYCVTDFNQNAEKNKSQFQSNPQEVSAVAWMTRDEMLAHPETL
jgi:hypothetical protein